MIVCNSHYLKPCMLIDLVQSRIAYLIIQNRYNKLFVGFSVIKTKDLAMKLLSLEIVNFFLN